VDDETTEFWFDREPGPLVRPFALTGGRAGTDRHGLNMITLVRATHAMYDPMGLSRESADIVEMCRHRPLSVAEIAARLDVLLAVAKVLISDLLDGGLLASQAPVTNSSTAPDMDLLQAVLDGVREL
jgi:uncharacterized protein DUF742